MRGPVAELRVILLMFTGTRNQVNAMGAGVMIQAVKGGNQPLGSWHIKAASRKEKIDLRVDVEESPAHPIFRRGLSSSALQSLLFSTGGSCTVPILPHTRDSLLIQSPPPPP